MVKNNDYLIPTLISYSAKDNQWSGYPSLMQHLNLVTSICGIPNFELYKLALAEYHKHKDIYDMEHNTPSLLMCKTLALAKQCSMYTVPDTEYAIESIMINIHVPGWHRDRYPYLAQPYLDGLLEVLVNVRPYLTGGRDSASNLSSEDFEILRNQLEKNFMVDYYSNWQANIKEPGVWVKDCLNKILSLCSESNRQTCSNIIERTLERLSKIEQDMIVTSLTKLKWYNKIFNAFN